MQGRPDGVWQKLPCPCCLFRWGERPKLQRSGAHLGNHIRVIGVDARVVEADGGGFDRAGIQLEGTEVERNAGVRSCVLEGVQAGAVAGPVKDVVALYDPVKDQALLAPAH